MSESESVEPGVVMEIENHNDPSTETPNEEASDSSSEINVTDLFEEDVVSEQDLINAAALAEKNRQKAERRRNRDFFAFIRRGEESSDDEPLEGEELLRELELHKKMREQVMKEVKKLCEAPYVKRFLSQFEDDVDDEDFDRSELEIFAAFMPNPYPL